MEGRSFLVPFCSSRMSKTFFEIRTYIVRNRQTGKPDRRKAWSGTPAVASVPATSSSRHRKIHTEENCGFECE